MRDNTKELYDLAGKPEESSFDEEAMKEQMVNQSVSQALKIERKNKQEIRRLKKHAEQCLFKSNFEGYNYSINKLRSFYKQPQLDIEAMYALYSSTTATLRDLVRNAK